MPDNFDPFQDLVDNDDIDELDMFDDDLDFILNDEDDELFSYVW